MVQTLTDNEVEGSDISNESKITLGILNAVHNDSLASQRVMANSLGIALGLANAYLKRCVKKGLIKISQAPANRYTYYLTPQGFAEKSRLTGEFLSQSFNLFRRTRTEGTALFNHCHSRGWKRVLLYGVGDMAEIFTLSARDHDVELVGIVGEQPGQFAGLMIVVDPAQIANVDAVIVCDIANPQAVYDRACRRFPPERVLAPRFLGIAKLGAADKGGIS